MCMYPTCGVEPGNPGPWVENWRYPGLKIGTILVQSWLDPGLKIA